MRSDQRAHCDGARKLLVAMALLITAGASATPPVGSSHVTASSPGAPTRHVVDRSTVNLSFNDAMALLSQRNQRLKAAAETERRSGELRAASRGLRLPRFDATAQWTRIDEPISINLEPVRAAILGLHPEVPGELVPAFALDVQDDHFFKAQLEMTWPVYTGGKVSAAIRAADARLEEARQQSRATAQLLGAELVHRYYGLQLAEQALEVRQQVFAGMEEHLYNARRLEEEGMIAHAERLHAEVAHAEALRELKAARHDVDLAAAALRTLLVTENDLHPSSMMFVIHELPALGTVQQRALENNPELGRLDAQQELAREATVVERAAYRPDVALFAVRELHTADLTILEPQWAAGIGVTLSLFDGFSRGHRVAAAQATESILAHLEHGARNDVALIVERHYRRLQKAVEQFDSVNATIALAEESLRVRSLAFREGFATSLDVVDARSSLAGARLTRLAIAHDFITSLADLLATAGQVERLEDYRQLATVEVTP